MADDSDGAEPAARVLISVGPETWSKLRSPKVLLALALGIAGAIAEVAGYLGASATIDPGEQLPYIISGGIGGIFLIGVAAILLFSADIGELKRQVADSTSLIRDLGRQLDDLHAKLSALDPPPVGCREEVSHPRRSRVR
jgi:hypothetical protein